MRMLAAGLVVLLSAVAAPSAAWSGGDGITIDVPVRLAEAKVVLNLDHAAFEGDEPTGLEFLRILSERFVAEGTKWQIVAIFHGAGGYMLLDDAAYDRVRNWQGGNPYKHQILALMKIGVEFEECVETMRQSGWTNADLIPGAKVNAGANFRIIELVQEGYVEIQP